MATDPHLTYLDKAIDSQAAVLRSLHQARDAYLAGLAGSSVEQVAALASESPASPPSLPSPSQRTTAKRGTMTPAVMGVFKKRPETWLCTADVAKQLIEQGFTTTAASVDRTVRRLAAAGRLERRKKGKARTAATLFRLPQQQSAPRSVGPQVKLAAPAALVRSYLEQHRGCPQSPEAIAKALRAAGCLGHDAQAVARICQAIETADDSPIERRGKGWVHATVTRA